MKKLYLILSLVLTLCLLCSCAEEALPEYIISNYDEESRLDLNDLINNNDSEMNSSTETSKDNSSDSELSDSESSVSEPSDSEQSDNESSNNEPSDSEPSDSEPSVSEPSYDESDNSKDDSKPDENNGSLLIKQKKYTYDGNDLIILDVTNESNGNYSITINGTYLDESGNVLKTEKKTFDQFSAGYKNYFLFKPEMKFSQFTYTVEASKTDAPCYAKDVKYIFLGLEENADAIVENDKLVWRPTIVAAMNYAYNGSVTVQAFMKCVLVNESDEIIAIFEKAPVLEYDPNPEGKEHNPIYISPSDKLDWPDNMEGTIRAFVVIEKVTDKLPDRYGG